MPDISKDEPKMHGVTAEFDSVDTLLAACRRVRDAGYTKTDAYTPFAVHGIDTALGIRPTALPWIVLGGGIVGALGGLGMEIWMNSIDYPYIISDKPFVSLPAFIPVSYELTILLASFGAFFGMLALNKLPRFSNPMFTNPRFDRATDDRFFLYIDAADPRFDLAGVQQLLGDMGALEVASVFDDDSSDAIPRPVFAVLSALVLLALLPPLLIARMRVTRSDNPRFHLMFDMDFSPAKDPQQTSTLFADGRAMRPDVPGTVARGQLRYDPDFYTGIDMDELARRNPGRAEQLVALVQQRDDASAEAADDQAADAPAADAPAVAEGGNQVEDASPAGQADAAAEPAAAAQLPVDNTPWLKSNPLELTTETLQLGQQQFNIYCAACHGVNGSGNGLVARRAQRILAQTWVPPSSLHQETLQQDRYPDGKLYNVITNGIRKMPSYGSQIPAERRWAVVAYVRALQRSRNASLDDVPADRRQELARARDELAAREPADPKAADAATADSE